MGAVYTTPMEPNPHLRPTLRQDVFNAALAVIGDTAKADQIASNFSELRRKTASNFSVPDDKRKAIEADLIAGGVSILKLREKHGVGTSTVQRVANELKAKGIELPGSKPAAAQPTS